MGNANFRDKSFVTFHGVRRSEPKVLGWSVRAVSLALALLFSLQQRFYFGIKYLNNHMRYHYKIDS